MEMCYKRLGKAIRETRLELDMRQEDLAKQAKMSRPALANIEAGRQRIALHDIFKLEEIFGVRNLLINKARGRNSL